jgi:hypothetical protein
LSNLRLSRLVLASLTCLFVLSPSVLSIHATTYNPAVTAGQWAEYKEVSSCLPVGSPACVQVHATGSGGLQNTDYGILKITDISGTNVTISLITAYTNGTNEATQGWVDVSTGGSSLVSLAGGAPSDYFILAGNLQATDGIWNTINAPTINQTTTESVLGQSRQVNVLNYTHIISNSYGTFTSSTQFSFDQATGILLGFSTASSAFSIYSGNYQTITALGMVANNIWRSDNLPDFTISNGGSITIQAGSSGTTTLTISGQYGFDSTINLQATTQAGLTCTLDKTTIRVSGTVTLSCAGQPGSYTVTITATSGSSSHNTQVPVQVNPARTPNQPTNQSTLIYIVIGVAATAAVASVASLLFQRRKKDENQTPPMETSPPTTTT